MQATNSYSGTEIDVANVAGWLFADDSVQADFNQSDWAGATAEDPPLWSIVRPNLTGQKFPSVEDLIERFNQDHADKQAERFLMLFDLPPDQQDGCRRELEDADLWAEGVRLRLEQLTQSDRQIICKFADAVTRDDFDTVEQIVDSLADNARHFGTLFSALGLTP